MPPAPPKPTVTPLTVSEHVKATVAKYGALLAQEPLLPSSIEVDDVTPVIEGDSTPKLEKSKDTRLIRPNGEIYLVRKLKLGDDFEVSDVDFVRTAYAHGMPLFLYGPPGTGKTALLEAALPNLVTLPGTGQTEASDFIGDWVQLPDGTYRWIDGPLPIAAENGWPLLIDEIALIDSRELAVVYSLMDGRDELVITANPARETVKAKPGFVVFGATNPDVPGAILSDALLSRFKIHAYVGTDWTLAKQLGVGSKIIQVARNLETKHRNNEVVAAPQLREVLTFRDTARVFGEGVAIRNFLSSARVEDRPIYQTALTATFGSDAQPLSF
jgi:nitric oxide reductase NorQ protein